MRELMRTNDPVVLSLARTLLEEAQIPAFVMDTEMSVMEGSIGVFPRRLMVPETVLAQARDVLEEAGLGEWLIRS